MKFLVAVVIVSASLTLAPCGVAPAQTIPCDSGTTDECTTAPSCQADGTCRGEPTNEGQPCTQNTSGDCMTNPLCRQGVCTGTVAADSGTPCFLPGLENCFEAGQCMSIPAAGVSICIPGAPKDCPAPSDPCQQAFCNPTTGGCEVADKCFTQFGCEVCNDGACSPTNIGNPCANAEGDFNPCTTNDRCVVIDASAIRARSTDLPPDVAGALGPAPQIAESRGFCMGQPAAAPPTPTPGGEPTPTPTTGVEFCIGDCNSDFEVTVDELILMVNVALGNAQVSQCQRGDGDINSEITVDEIVSAVNRALNGCV